MEEDYLICTEIDDEDTQNESNNSGQKAVFIKKFIWEQNTTITIGFFDDGAGIDKKDSTGLKDIDPLEHEISNLTPKKAVQKVVQERIQPLVNLNLQFIDVVSDAIIRISFVKGKGSWSTNGNNALKLGKDKATMNFGWLDVRTILHEFGHVLGMEHEHQGPYSNIQWNSSAVYKFYQSALQWDTARVDNQIIKKRNYLDVIGSEFDPLSIMLYFFDSRLTTNNLGTPENHRLSGYDVVWIAKTYPVTNGISPADFYFKTYGISLADSLAESDKLAEKYPKAWTWWQILLIIILWFLILAGIIFLIEKFHQNKKPSYHRVNYHDKYL
jgi:hypothetical protein